MSHIELPDTPLQRAQPARVAKWLRHALAVLFIALLAWFAFRGYRQPEMLLELANYRLC